jgi:hypothetical protein
MAKSEAQKFKERQLRTLPKEIGIYALCDLDEAPIYVGQSKDAIYNRVRRHLTSARSDVIANRQIDVWEIAYVWAWPVTRSELMKPLEHHLYDELNAISELVNGKVLAPKTDLKLEVPEKIRVQVMPDDLIKARCDPSLRFPRQIQHFNQLVDYILNTQDKPHLRRALKVYYKRLTRYYKIFLEDGRKQTKKASNRNKQI